MKEHIGKFGILYVLLILGIGIFVGSQWSKWFPPSIDRIFSDSSNLKAKCQQYGDGTCSFRGIEVPCSACSDRGLL